MYENKADIAEEIKACEKKLADLRKSLEEKAARPACPGDVVVLRRGNGRTEQVIVASRAMCDRWYGQLSPNHLPIVGKPSCSRNGSLLIVNGISVAAYDICHLDGARVTKFQDCSDGQVNLSAEIGRLRHNG